MVDTVPGGIVVFYRNGQVMFANRVAERPLGLEKMSGKGGNYPPEWIRTDYEGNPLKGEDLLIKR